MHAPYLIRRRLQAVNGSTEKTESSDEGSRQSEVIVIEVTDESSL